METTNPTMKKLLRLTNSSQAKKSLEVAIELGTREKQVNNLFRKFWKLKRQYRLYQIYPEIEHSLPSFLNLHRVLKKRGLNPDNVDWFVNALETGTVYVSILTLIGIQLQNMQKNNQKR